MYFFSFLQTKNSPMEEALLPIYIKQENLEEGLEAEEESFFEKHVSQSFTKHPLIMVWQ